MRTPTRESATGQQLAPDVADVRPDVRQPLLDLPGERRAIAERQQDGGIVQVERATRGKLEQNQIGEPWHPQRRRVSAGRCASERP
jgi:hypothetical protein